MEKTWVVNVITIHCFRAILGDSFLVKVIAEKTTLLLYLLLQPHWLDYNHLYVFGKSLHLQEYQIMKRGYEAGLSKSQVANIFHNQEVLVKVQLSPVEAIG